jgi:DNA-binding NtrC family response regulator
VRQEKFREDLFYRLNVLPIALPPLRDRREDIPTLAKFHVDAYNSEFKKRVRGITAEALRKLQSHAWPGNVRELRNAVERAMLLAEGDVLTHRRLRRRNVPRASERGRRSSRWGDRPGKAGASLVVQALERTGWNQNEGGSAARAQSRSNPLPNRKISAPKKRRVEDRFARLWRSHSYSTHGAPEHVDRAGFRLASEKIRARPVGSH